MHTKTLETGIRALCVRITHMRRDTKIVGNIIIFITIHLWRYVFFNELLYVFLL